MYLSGMWLDVHPRMDTKRCVFIRNQTMCLECANHYMLNREHSWGEGGGLYNNSTSTRTFTLIMNEMFI